MSSLFDTEIIGLQLITSKQVTVPTTTGKPQSLDSKLDKRTSCQIRHGSVVNSVESCEYLGRIVNV
jgi:hypothetical protein